MTRQIKNDPPAKKIAILIGTSIQWGRQVIDGIHQYSHHRSPWHFFLEPCGMDEVHLLPNDWKGDGVIARISSPDLACQLLKLNIPVVNISGIQIPETDTFPRVTTDNQLFSESAVSYFQDLGINHLGYFGLSKVDYIEGQCAAFIKATEQAGLQCSVYEVQPGFGAAPAWNLNISALREWIKKLPKPIGILTWNASCASQISYACELENIFVPDDVAILSAVDDDLLCNLSKPALSAIDLQAKKIGYQAAHLLDQLLDNKKIPKQNVFIEPAGIISRQSTDTLAIKDKQLALAVRYIRNNANKNIQVSDVSKYAGLSKRVLERRFTEQLDRTPAQEIRRVRLDNAKQLLVKTDLSIPAISEFAGFGSPEYMAYVFRQHSKITPLAYRRENRLHD